MCIDCYNTTVIIIALIHAEYKFAKTYKKRKHYNQKYLQIEMSAIHYRILLSIYILYVSVGYYCNILEFFISNFYKHTIHNISQDDKMDIKTIHI